MAPALIPSSEFARARRRFVERAEELDPHGDAELMLSGGVDSTTVLFALLEAGRRPRCITFYLEGVVSDDLRSARRLCQHFGLELVEVVVPRDPAVLLADVRRVLQLVDWSGTATIRKTVVQCVHPFLYVYPQAGRRLLNGLGGDSFFLSTKNEAMEMARRGEMALSHWRRSYAADPDTADYHIMDVGRRHYGCANLDFYDFPWFAGWIQQFPPSVTHRPRKKWATVGIFEDYWRQGGFYRQPSAFQVNSGLREHHDRLLALPPYDALGAKQVVAVYRRIAQELGITGVGSSLPPRRNGFLLAPDGTEYGLPPELQALAPAGEQE